MATGPMQIQLLHTEALSAGHFSSVFIGRVVGGPGEAVAIKTYERAPFVDPDRGSRLSRQTLREARALGMLTELPSPFVVKGLFAAHDDARLLVGMELVGGGVDLFSLIHEVGPIGVDWARFYAAELTLALGHVHSFDIVYRDLKPENVLIGLDGHVKLCDFNSCVMLRGRVGNTPPPERIFSLCGTPQYLSWEMVLGRMSCETIDWWSLGVLNYEMLTGGATPFTSDGDTFSIVLRRIVEGFHAIPGPSNFDPLSQDIISALLTQNPNERLGARPHGYRAVLEHPWFGGVDVAAVLRKEVPAPWVPPTAHGAALAPHQAPAFDPVQTHAQGRAIATAAPVAPWEDEDDELIGYLATTFAQEAVVVHVALAGMAVAPMPAPSA